MHQAIESAAGQDARGDVHEEQADRLADEIMRAPAPSHASPATSARSAGSLDASTRDFMERRFGHNFGGVRIHADRAGAVSAGVLGARAFTLGSNIIFGAGEYSPGTSEGRRLIAHELVHVIQQGHSPSVSTGAGLDRNGSPDAPPLRATTINPVAGACVQLAPDKKSSTGFGVPEHLLLHTAQPLWPKGMTYEDRILLIAANPDQAEEEWKRLSKTDRFAVTFNMARFYGEAFASEFVAQRNSGKRPATVFSFVDSDTKPADLVRRGFQLAGIQHQLDVEIWFHPSGARLHRKMAVEKPKPAEKIEEPIEDEAENDEATVDVEEAEVSELQQQAFGLLDELRKLDSEMEALVKGDSVDMGEFIDKEGDFGELRRELNDLIHKDPAILEGSSGTSIVDERKALVEWFLRLTTKAYGVDRGDWNKPPGE